MTVLYILENGANISLEGGTYKVEYLNGLIRKIPKETLESITVIGKSQITTQCVCDLLERGIPVTYLSRKGKYFGRLESTKHRNILREKKQLKLTENNSFQLEVAKKFIEGKVNNQIVLLRNYKAYNEDLILENIKLIKRIYGQIEKANTLNELIGYEGNAARIYYETINLFIQEEFKFKGRSRRPPLDAFNAMLSFGYTLLMYIVYEAIESRGLNPYGGFLHRDRERHPTLASDIMEEFRSVIVDSSVISLIQRKKIKIDEFEKMDNEKGIIIKDSGIKKVVMEINKKLETENKYFNKTTTYRRGIWLQVGKILESIENEDSSMYAPLKVR